MPRAAVLLTDMRIDYAGMSHLPARIALMLGNFVIGVSVFGLAGMLADLAGGLGVTIRHAGLLVTAGAVVLCIGAPLMVWATNRFDRRLLLASVLSALALGHVASALAPNYATLLGLRVSMMVFAALFTPVATSTVASIVSRQEQAGAIAFLFLGYSLAMAGGLPALAASSAQLGWRVTFALLGAVALGCAALLLAALPKGLRGAPISLGSWAALARNGLVRLLLSTTVLLVSGQFVLFTYLGPLVTRLTGATVAAIGTFFSIFGVMGFVGNLIATRLVRTLEPFRTSLAALLSVLLGFMVWSAGAGVLAVMGAGVALWGLGFAAISSMQQARLVAAVPALASAAVALNTSAIYIGQALGSALGGELFARDLPHGLGYAALTFAALSLAVLAMTRQGNPAR